MNNTWNLNGSYLEINSAISISFQRSSYAHHITAGQSLCSLGLAPLAIASKRKVHCDIIVAIENDESFWIGLVAVSGAQPTAIRVVIQSPINVDVATGTSPIRELCPCPQNYVVVPPQLALDGIHYNDGNIKRFYRVNRGQSICELFTIEAFHGKHIIKTPTVGPTLPPFPAALPILVKCGSSGPEPIIRDPYGVENWDACNATSVSIRLVSYAEFESYTRKDR